MSSIPRIHLTGILPSDPAAGVPLEGRMAHYLLKVLRLQEGARIVGFDALGAEYDLLLHRSGGDRWDLLPQGRKEPTPGRGISLALGQSLPKGSKMDQILRQCTEAGIDRFLPLLTRRSVSRPGAGQWPHKAARWGKILVEACRQCGRNAVPTLDPVQDWQAALERFREFDLVLLPFEGTAPDLASVLYSRPDVRRILLLIGPEGGWSPEEIQEAQDREAVPVHLPLPILRTETAGVAAAAMVHFHYGRGSDEGKEREP